MNRIQHLVARWALPVSALLVLTSAAGCGTASDAGTIARSDDDLLPPAALAEPTPTPGPASTPTPTVTPAPEPTSTQEVLDEVAMQGDADRGETIFQETAGGVGCQLCHGEDARGVIGPDIRGKDATIIAGAFGWVGDMMFIRITNQEIEDVAAYLATLVPDDEMDGM